MSRVPVAARILLPTLLLYAVLADLAVETWLSGTHLRKWSGGAVLVYGLLVVLANRRRAAPFRPYAPHWFLLTLIVVSAWLPGGAQMGIRLLGLATPAVLSFLTGVACLVAAFTLWHQDSWPRLLKATMSVVAIVTAGACLYAGIAGEHALAGTSVWTGMPRLVRIFILGGLGVALIALGQSAARLIRPLTAAPRRSLIRQAATIAAGLAVAVPSLPGSPAALAGPAVRSRGLQTAPVQHALDAILQGDRDSPRDRWDPGYVAARLGSEPLDHLAWVRERTAWVPYRGALRGPVGVLLDRQGNSLDRALLLATLLERAGHTIRLAHTELSIDQARELMPGLVAQRRSTLSLTSSAATTDWRPDFLRTAANFGFDSLQLVQSVEPRMDQAARMLERLDRRTEAQSARLQEVLRQPEAGQSEPKDSARYLEALRDHWWVELQESGRWLDLDVLGIAHVPSGAAPSLRVEPGQLDSALYHRVVVRLVTERHASNSLAEQRSLEWEFRPSEVIGMPIVLHVLPSDWQPGLFANARDPAAALRAAALDAPSWKATLTVGSRVVQDVVIKRTGEARDAAAGGALGGLGQGITGALAPGSDELSAAWMEYEIRVPGEVPRTARRRLFDLVGPAARASRRPVRLALGDQDRLERSLALTRSTEILPLAGAIAPEYLLHLVAEAALANRNFLRADAPASNSPGEAMERFGRLAAPAPSTLYTLAAVRFPADPESEVFLDRPNILSQHDFLVPRTDRIVRIEATDIVANEIGVAPGARRPAEIRRRQGVRDTNAEALLYLDRPVVGSVAERFDGAGTWVAVRRADDGRLVGLEPDLRQSILDDLSAGYIVVLPEPLAGQGTPEQLGWWRTDPGTGQTLGVSGTGWGQVMSERAKLQAYVLLAGTMAEAWFFEFLICGGALGTPPGQAVASGATIPDWLVTPLYAEEEGNPCVWEAWKAALLAGLFHKASVVWPLMLKRFTFLRQLERPLFASGPALPGEAPPIFGKPPAAPPPPPECPPGAGGAGAPPRVKPPEDGVDPLGQTQPTEGGPAKPDADPVRPAEPGEVGPPKPEVDPLGQTQPGEGAVSEPAPGPTRPRPEESEAPYSPLPHRNLDDADLPPLDPEWVAGNVQGWSARQPRAREALAEAQASARQAEEAAEQARQELKAFQQKPPAPGDNEGLQRMADAQGKINDATRAQQNVASAEAEVARLEALTEQWHRVQQLNDALLQARAEAREATLQFRKALDKGADFQGDEYKQWQSVYDRYNRAHREYVKARDAVGKAPSSQSNPGPGGGGTMPMPERPTPPGPGQTQPLGDSPPPSTCSSAGPPEGSPPAGSPPAGESPPPGASPPRNSPPPSPLADARRRLAEATAELEAARADLYRLDHDIPHPDGSQDLGEFTAAERELYAREKQLAAEGKELGPHTDEYQRLLQLKINAVDKVLKLQDALKQARFQAEWMERLAQAPVSPQGGAGGSTPPQTPVLVGLGAMAPAP